MLSKNQIKLIKSLAQKKTRQQLGLFIVEGIKGVSEFLNSNFILEHMFTTDPIFETSNDAVTIITAAELKKISGLKNPNTVLAVFKIPKSAKIKNVDLVIALDAIRDPGNLGTIIRLCDWYGVADLICSLDTVDCYNSKVVQASMGSLTRVNVVYTDLEVYLKASPASVMGTFMTGTSIYTADLPKKGIIVFGNEANGISEALKQTISQKLTIPQFGDTDSTESLNVANATAIVLSEFRRRSIER